MPLPGVTNTPTPFGSWRSKPSDGELRTVTSVVAERAGDHRRRAAAVEVERGLGAERRRTFARVWRSVDAEHGRLAAVGGDEHHRLAAVLEADRGPRVDASSTGARQRDAVPDERLTLPPTANCILSRDLALEAVGRASPRRRARARGSRPRAASRPTSTKRSAGISPAPVPVALTETTLPSVTSTSATLVAPEHAAAARVRAPQRACTRHVVRGPTSPLAALSVQHGARALQERRAGLEREVDEPADAVLADAGVVAPVPMSGDLSIAPPRISPAERGGRVVDVEEVAVDAGDGARLFADSVSGPPGRRPAPVSSECDLTAGLGGRRTGSAGRTSRSSRPSRVAERDSGPDGLGLVDQREPVRRRAADGASNATLPRV